MSALPDPSAWPLDHPPGDENKPKKRLLIVLPCLNEAATIGRVIADLPRKIGGIDNLDVLVVDDGSDLLPNLPSFIRRVCSSFALRPNFGSPAVRVFRLCHDDGLVAPT